MPQIQYDKVKYEALVWLWFSRLDMNFPHILCAFIEPFHSINSAILMEEENSGSFPCNEHY